MIDLTDTQAEVFRELSATTTLEGFVTALAAQADRLGDLTTKQWPVHHVDPPAVGAALLYAEDGWDGTFMVVLRAALMDAFDSPELLTLVVWTRNEDPNARAKASLYIKTVGQAGDDVLGESDGNGVVRFYDGKVIDLDDVVAVSF